MIRRWVILVAVLLVACSTQAQETSAVLRGRVTCGGHGVPYATVQLKGTSIGVTCNDAGDYLLKLPEGREADTVVVRSVGYVTGRFTVAAMLKNGNVKLREQHFELKEVKVRGYRSGRFLIQAAVDRINDNYQQKTGYSTFFFRDWRALNGEMFLFDEAVMRIKRVGYQAYSDKMAYLYDQDRREMASNYKTLLRHRLVVYDAAYLARALDDPDGVEEQMAFADNESFFDPVATPQATYSMAKRVLPWHQFEPVQEFVADGVGYYLVRSVGPGNSPKAKVHNEWLIRKEDLAIVRYTSSVENLLELAPDYNWVNYQYTHMLTVKDTSAWTYDVHGGAYTLTHYYNSSDFIFGTKNYIHVTDDLSRFQRWQLVKEWTLTDYSLVADTTVHGTEIKVRPQTLAGAFGESDYDVDYWKQYNSIYIDTMPARLLKEKLIKLKDENQ